jgi:diketogulonate reductase-like aldo/keto reductase
MRHDLLNNSYAGFTPSSDSYAVRAYQRCFRGLERRKLFFISVYEYSRSKANQPRFDAKAQFKNAEGRYFDVCLHHWDTVEELNGFFYKIFEDMGCIPYDG